MKNLITKLRKGESLKDNIESKNERQARWYGGLKSTYHDVDGVYPNKRINRICEAYLGKQFSKAFSEYCKQVPIYQQKFFLDEFNKSKRMSYWDYYFIDKQGNIQKHIGDHHKNKKKVKFRSDDFKTERRHKVTGEPRPQYTWMLGKKFKESDYVEVIVAGYEKEFSSAKDPEFIRLTQEQIKRRKRRYKIAEKEKAEKAYSFISQGEKEVIKEKAKDKVKIEAKGFDYETSFRNDNQTNPDTIKDRQ